MKFKTFISVIIISLCAAYVSTAIPQPYEASERLDPSISLDNLEFSHSGVQQGVHYAFAGKQEKPGIIFIHGTPGGWQAFELYLANHALQEEFFMVSIDRAGWGQSLIQDDGDMSRKQIKSITTTFGFQATAVTEIMQRYPNKKWIIVGHSLGASIAPKIALLDESRVKALVLLAGSLNPKLGKPRWYNRFASTLLLKWMLPDNLAYSNDEIMQLRTELTEIEQQFNDRRLAMDVVVIQGMKDKLVSPRNAKYVGQQWADKFASLTVLELPEAGHFLPWNETPLVVETLRKLAKSD